MLIYEYKLDGNKMQYAAIDEAIRVTQFVRNKCLRLWMDAKPEDKIDGQAMNRHCAVLAKEFEFAAKLNSQARQSAAERTWIAVSRFYDHCKAKKPGKKGYPKFQHDNRSVEYKVTGWKLDPDGKHLLFTDGLGIGRLRMMGTREVVSFPLSQIKRVRIVRRAAGYYVQFCLDADRQVTHTPTEKQRGIDMGLKAFYTDSEGQMVHTPQYLHKAERRIKYLQRQVSRKFSQERKKAKEPQSHNYQKAKQQLAKAHLQVARQREDFARKAASALVTSSDLIAYEDLQIANLVKNHTLAKSISDAAWGRFLTWVNYYAGLHGILVVAVPPHYTSQQCSGCGQIVQKTLSTRTHVCEQCGLVMDRDENAARNILALALESVSRTVGQTETGPGRRSQRLGNSGQQVGTGDGAAPALGR